MKTPIAALVLIFSFALKANPGINFAVSEEEQELLHKEIKRAGQSVPKFLQLLKGHASLSKSAYSQAVKNMHPVVRTAVDKSCMKDETKDIIYQSICYRDTLNVMENDVDLILDAHYSKGEKLIDLREELIAKNHFVGKILFDSCSKKASELCMENKLSSLHEELILAYNKMSQSVDELARWSVLSYTCNNHLSAVENCAALKTWTSSDFIADAKKIKYVPFNKKGTDGGVKPKKEEKSENHQIGREKLVESTGTKAKVDVLDCTPEAKNSYREKSLEMQSLDNFDEILVAQQKSYSCLVQEYHSENPAANLLSKLGLKMARVAQDMIVMSPEICSAHLRGIKGLVPTMRALQSAEPSKNLETLTDEFERMNDTDCSAIFAMISGQSSNIPLRDNLCAWMEEIESKSKGSTVGFSSVLAPCK